MKTVLLTALLLGASAAASAQNYQEQLADVNMVAETAPASTLKVDAGVYANQAAKARPRAVRVATNPRSLTVALAHSANIVMASANIGG